LALSSDDLRAILAQNGVDGTTYLLSARIGATVVDLLLAETEYQRTAMARAIDGVLTVGDVIVHKLIAGRPRDDDIRSILTSGVTVDDSYVDQAAQLWGVADHW
jgi:hypothetical protein